MWLAIIASPFVSPTATGAYVYTSTAYFAFAFASENAIDSASAAQSTGSIGTRYATKIASTTATGASVGSIG